jgi:hypothetical protein
MSMPSPKPTRPPTSSPAIATRNVNHDASTTATPTDVLSVAADSGRPKRRNTSHTCGIEASSARGSSRTPNSDPPSGLPIALYASHNAHTSSTEATNHPARTRADRVLGARGGAGAAPWTTATAAGSAPTPVNCGPGGAR